MVIVIYMGEHHKKVLFSRIHTRRHYYGVASEITVTVVRAESSVASGDELDLVDGAWLSNCVDERS